jgi:hypothetical protein
LNVELETLLLAFPSPESDFKARLEWLEALALATSRAEELGDSGARAALDLRAALGAFVEYARSEKTPADDLALQLAVKALISRALHTIYGALASAYKELATADTAHDLECRELAKLWAEAQRALERGTPIPRVTIQKLEELRARVLESEA